MKTATYRLADGTDTEIEYDETAPCWMCGLPVGSASMGGTVVCPACDCGKERPGGIYHRGKSYCTECGARVVTFGGGPTGIMAYPCKHQSKLMWAHPHPFGPCDCNRAARRCAKHSLGASGKGS